MRSNLLVFIPLLVVGLLWASAPAAAAPAGRISGTVTDRSTGEALPGANVLIAGTSIGTATDLDGRYTIPNAPSGQQTLVITYIGYDRQEMVVEVPEGGTLQVDVQLDWEAAEGQEIVITAQAEGQVAAINQQLASNTIANIVSAARIQELPDVNAAESIGRLPGVAIQRSGGEANKISIRGLSPKYSTVSVNGVRMPSTSGDDRSVDLSLISPNMLDGIEVRKAITPDQDADAIGGSVDLKLREAPEGFMVDVLAQGGYNQLQEYLGNYKLAASASNRFLDNRLGLIVSGNLDSYDRSADKLSGGYRRAESTGAGGGGQVLIITNRVTREENVDRGRIGGSAVADFRIPMGKLTANSFYNQLTNDALHRVHDVSVSSGGHNYYDLLNSHNTTSILTGAFGVEQDFGLFRYDATLARTASRSESPENFTFRFGAEGNVLTAPANENTTPQGITSIIRVDSATALNNIFVQSFRLEENETSAQLNLRVPFRIGNTVAGYVKTGGKLRWLDRLNDQEQNGRGNLQYGGAGSGTHPLACIDQQLPDWNIFETVEEYGWLPINSLMSDYTREDFLAGDYELGLVADEAKMLQLAQALQTCDEHYRNQSVPSLGRDYNGIERYQAGYAMAEFNLGRRVTLIPGVRWEGEFSRYHGQRFRAVNSAGIDTPPDDLTALTNERENDFWLPMVHLQVKPIDWLTVRLAYTETLTRPDYIQFAPITSIDAFRSFVNANNALIRPAQAQNYDAAVSVYNNKIGLFTVAGFYKSIDDLVRGVNFTLRDDPTFKAMFAEQFPGTNVPESWYAGASPTIYTTINNPFVANYRGLEVDWQTNFWYLPSLFKGLVVNANYTYISSETTYQGFYTRNGEQISTRPVRYAQVIDDTLRTGRMPDQPSHIGNLTLGYDWKGFSTRLSFLYQANRSSYVDPLTPLLDAFSGDYFRVDATLRQKLGNGLEVFANLNNLNSQPDKNYQSSPSATHRPNYIEYYGFTMDLGARYRF